MSVIKKMVAGELFETIFFFMGQIWATLLHDRSLYPVLTLALKPSYIRNSVHKTSMNGRIFFSKKG